MKKRTSDGVKVLALAAAAVALLAGLTGRGIAVGGSAEGRARAPKYKIVLAQTITIEEAKTFLAARQMQPLSVTFRGPDHACGGTVDSVEAIDDVAARIAETWRRQTTDASLDRAERDKVKGKLARVEREGWAISEIEVDGQAPADLDGDPLVDEVVRR
jgi:hypothetical protein